MPSRRRYLAAVAALPVAGCVSGQEETDGQSPAGQSPTGQSPVGATDSPTPTEESGDESAPDEPASIESDWPTPGHDHGLSSYAPVATGPVGEIASLWEASAGTSLSSPVVTGGTLYVGGDDGTVLALDARNGEERWTTSVGGSAGQPWVTDGEIYVPTADEVVSLAGDGSERWRVATPDRTGLLVAAHGVYYVADGEDPQVVGRDRADGGERWRAAIDDPWGEPVFADDRYVFVSSRSNSPYPWIFDVTTGDFVGSSRPAYGADFPEARLYHDGEIYSVESFFGSVTAIDVADDGMSQEWKTSYSGVGQSSLAVGADHVYGYTKNGGEPILYAFARSDGQVSWDVQLTDIALSRPVVTAETILVRTEAGLQCYDPADGSERWTHSGDGVGDEVVVADDLVYTTTGSTVRAFRSI